VVVRIGSCGKSGVYSFVLKLTTDEVGTNCLLRLLRVAELFLLLDKQKIMKHTFGYSSIIIINVYLKLNNVLDRFKVILGCLLIVDFSFVIETGIF
jgi:hypothetical protein